MTFAVGERHQITGRFVTVTVGVNAYTDLVGLAEGGVVGVCPGIGDLIGVAGRGKDIFACTPIA